MKFDHAFFEKNSLFLLIGILVVVSIGGLVEIAPLFWLSSTVEKVQGMRPYSPLELRGRDIYIREGCYACHSQMVRSLRDEVERYGPYSLAAESMYDHPFQWGSKRTGPDLARVGGKYSDDWHVEHMINPRSVVPESIMPEYAFLKHTPLDIEFIEDRLVADQMVGVPYTDANIASAKEDLLAQLDPYSDGIDNLYASYGDKVVARNFDGQAELTEMDALIAYLQVLGTMVDFSTFEPDASR